MSEERAPVWLAPAGLFIGFLASLCGIGGGLFAGAILHFGLGFELRRATGTALVLVFGTTAAATITESLQADSALQWALVLAMFAGVLVGAQLGFIFSERVSERVLRLLFAVALLVAGLRVLTTAAVGQDTGVEAIGALDYAWSLVVGLGGGFVAPVLGVGGGLVMVPGLFLGVAGVGFDAARACSLAAGALGSARSLALKQRAGRVSWRHGIPLGIGALVGAGLGVVSLDAFEGLLEVGRILLGVTLVGVAVRFGLAARA